MMQLGPRYLEYRDNFGRSPILPYRLIACPVTDRNGNTVDISHGDTVTVGGKTYTAIYVNDLSWMKEAIIEARQ